LKVLLVVTLGGDWRIDAGSAEGVAGGIELRELS
jgi:hypothetical protein